MLSSAAIIFQHTGKRTAAIGDGGNDVSMIQVKNLHLSLGPFAYLACVIAVQKYLVKCQLLLLEVTWCLFCVVVSVG